MKNVVEDVTYMQLFSKIVEIDVLDDLREMFHHAAYLIRVF